MEFQSSEASSTSLSKLVLDAVNMRHFNFSVQNEEMCDNYIPQKKRSSVRDPISHRIIEKRRRDRMNTCLAELSQLLPETYLKQRQGRIEKTEIIEMANKYIKKLQNQVARGQETMPGFGYQACCDEVMNYLMHDQGYNGADSFCTSLMRRLQEKGQQLPERVADFLNRTGMLDMEKSTQGIKQEDASKPAMTTCMETIGISQVENHVVSAPSPEFQEQRGSASQDCYEGDLSNSLSPAKSNFIPSNAGSPGSARPPAASGFREFTADEGSGRGFNREGIALSEGNALSVDSPACGNSHKVPSSHGSDETRDSTKCAYKFKEDLKLRFREVDTTRDEAEVHNTHSTILIEDDHGNAAMPQQDTRRFPDQPLKRVRSHCSESAIDNRVKGRYVQSPDHDGYSPNSGRQPEVNTAQGASPIKSESCEDMSPGFALHPTGTFYVPVMLSSGVVSPYMCRFSSHMACHPITIPVNFGGTCIRHAETVS